MKKTNPNLHWMYTFGISLAALGVIFSATLHKKTGSGYIGLAIIIIGVIMLIIGIKKSKK